MSDTELSSTRREQARSCTRNAPQDKRRLKEDKEDLRREKDRIADDKDDLRREKEKPSPATHAILTVLKAGESVIQTLLLTKTVVHVYKGAQPLFHALFWCQNTV